MSDATATSGGGFFTGLLAAIEHGANTVYHEVVAAEPDVTKWTTAHPEVGELIGQGLNASISFASRLGVPGAAIASLAIEDITAALKGKAAGDATVQSGAPAPPAQVQITPAMAAPS